MFISTKLLGNYIDLTDVSVQELDLLINKHIIELDGSNSLINATKLVIGHVVEREKHPDSDKLSVCQVNVGSETLQIVCGAKNVAKGQKVIVALIGAVLPGDFKIGKSKIRGVESFGMICSLSELGIENKFLTEEDKEGIKVLDDSAVPGACPIEFLELDTHVFELGLTPNRMDLLSYFGFAKDLGAVLNKEANLLDVELDVVGSPNDVKISMDTNNAPYYGVMKLSNLKVGPSEQYIQAALIANGIRPINNVVDATNYVMLETGCPLHAFDARSVKGEITVRNSNYEEVVTLDGNTRNLNDKDIVITSNNEVLAIAGIMGSLASSVNEETTDIVLEGALFNEVAVRSTSSRLGLRTDASVRFERKIDPNMIGYALSRCAQLIQAATDCDVYAVNEVAHIDLEDLETEIEISTDRVNGYLGTKLTDEELIEVFQRLGFDTILDAEYDNLTSVLVPSRRLDVNTFQDLCEEVARIYGFDKIPSTLPTSMSKNHGLTPWQAFVRKVRKTMLGYGLNEAITYSLVSKESLALFGNVSEESTKLLMPLSEEREYLRNSLIPSLIDVVEYNKKRNIKDVNIFEIGTLYEKGETKELCVMLNGSLGETTWTESFGSLSKKDNAVDFYTVKGLLEALLREFNVKTNLFQVNDLVNYHPGQSGLVMVNGVQIGEIGLLHPTYLKQKDLDKTYVFTICLNTLFSLVKNEVYFKEVPKFPSMTRDIAVVVDKEITIESIKQVVTDAGKKMLKDVTIFDVYTGDKVELGTKSVAIKLVFQDLEKTLETEEVNQRFNKIIKDLEHKLNAKLRS